MTGPTPLSDAARPERRSVMHSEIRDRICLLTYPPGMRLSEATLAKEFGTSRTPIRRVLAQLEDEGLVVSQHGVGTFVTDADISALEQTYRLRVELTALVGRLDPVAPSPDLMARLQGLLARGEQIIQSGTPYEFTRFDMDVFQTFLELTANEPLRQTLERLYFQTKRIWLRAAIEAQLDLTEEFKIFQQELDAVYLALKIGDLDAAARVQQAHISMSFKRLQRWAR